MNGTIFHGGHAFHIDMYEVIYDAINLLPVPLDLLNSKNELNHSSHVLKSVNIYPSKIGQVSRPVYHFCLFVVVVSRVYLMCFIKSIYCLRCFFFAVCLAANLAFIVM